MIDQNERQLAQAIADASSECVCLREARLTEDGQHITQDQIDAADITWVDAQEAYVEAGYSLDALEAN